LHKKYGIPYILAIRNTDVNIFYKFFLHLRKLGYNILENASQIIFISPAYQEHFVNCLLPKKIKDKIFNKSTVIPNGAFPFWLDHKAPKKEISTPVKLLSIGTIDANKNYLTLCYAVDLLRLSKIDIELTIVGKGYQDDFRYLKKLEKYIRNKPHIKLIEKQNQEELIKTYREHDIFVLPSHKETFGLVYVEALTQGLPIVFTQGQGIDGYFESGKIGYAVHSKNIDEIAQAISSIINNYSEFAMRVTQLDFSIFDWEPIAERYLTIYQNCMK
jgi:glycosyltransferase involved in cell wall biosynthesis